jgi:hypothetical protein
MKVCLGIIKELKKECVEIFWGLGFIYDLLLKPHLRSMFYVRLWVKGGQKD